MCVFPFLCLSPALQYVLTHLALVQSSNPQRADPPEGLAEVEKGAETEVLQPRPRRARARGPVVSRFKGFDDDDDEPTASNPGLVDSQVGNSINGEKSQLNSVCWRF